jgi:hypothetical protein
MDKPATATPDLPPDAAAGMPAVAARPVMAFHPDRGIVFRDVQFKVDEDAALAGLERAWADVSYHGFCVLDGSVWSAIASSGEVLTGSTPDGLDQQVRTHWRALQ